MRAKIEEEEIIQEIEVTLQNVDGMITMKFFEQNGSFIHDYE